jgi:hypothetical protein
MTRTQMVWYIGTTLTALAMLATSVTVVAQPPIRTVADSSAAERHKAASVKGFRGLAARLNTTPEALDDAFEHARLANPKLSRGNFVAANVLADNLGPEHPGITTPAILSGLQRGKSLGQTLQSLGLSASEAKQSRRDADRQTKDADRSLRDADRRDEKASRAAHGKSRGVANEKKAKDQ